MIDLVTPTLKLLRTEKLDALQKSLYMSIFAVNIFFSLLQTQRYWKVLMKLRIWSYDLMGV